MRIGDETTRSLARKFDRFAVIDQNRVIAAGADAPPGRE